MQRLEIIADTYLSVATPVQVAAARLLEHGAQVRQQIADRVLLNYDVLRSLAAEHPALSRAAGRRRLVGRGAGAGHHA